MSTRFRRLSPSESLYLAGSRTFPPFAIQLWIEGDGNIDANAWTTAVRSAAAANPGARLVARGRWWLDGGLAPSVRAEDAVFSLDHAALRMPFDARNAVPCEVVLFPTGGILFRCSHALMDAQGLLFFAAETFRALRSEKLRGNSRVISDVEMTRANGGHGARRASSRARSASPIGKARSITSGFTWETRRLGGNVPAFPARLQSAVARLTAARAPGAPVQLLVPVSLRAGDAASTTVNLAAPLLLDVSGVNAWPEALRRTVGALSSQEHLASHPFERAIPWLPVGWLASLQAHVHQRCVRRDRFLFSAVVSHVGSVSLSTFSAAGFDARAVRLMPFDAPGAALTLVTLEHDDGIELSASAPSATADGGGLSAALDDLLRDFEPITRRSAAGHPSTYTRFIETVTRTPNSTAVSAGATRWTYSHLAARARRWATCMRDAGVRRGDRVALVAARSPDVVAALLGVMHVGGEFVCVDPDWPEQRLRFVLADCAPACVIVDSAHEKLATEHARLMLDDETQVIGDPPPFIEPTDDTPAYRMYTSGSTGQPKAVIVGHGSLSNYLAWARTHYFAERAPVFPLFTSLGFDLTLTALFVPLIAGGEVRVFAHGDPLLAARALLEDPSLDAIKLTPSHLRLLCEIGLERSGVRTLIVGGEALTAELAQRAARQNARIEIFNEYGPTEATVGCTVHRFDSAADVTGDVPVGRPIEGARVELLDSGEILIAGRCLALGYAGAPPESVRFVSWRGQRAYHSGDLGSLDAAGNLHFIGRMDDQVKIRGQRIELGEIEAALRAYPGVRDAVAFVENPGEHGALAACVVWREAADVPGLRRHLTTTLPLGWIPARFVALDELPLNVNGKVDRHQLGAPRLAATPTVPSARVSELREMLAEIMQIPASSLHTERSLLDQGCDSLSLAVLLQRATARHLPSVSNEDLATLLDEFIRNPSLRGLSSIIERRATP